MSDQQRPATIAAERLKSFIERVEKLEEERRAIGGDVRDVYAEAKGAGFDVKAMRRIVAARRMDGAERDELGEIIDLYCVALGAPDLASVAGVPTGDLGGRNDTTDERAIRAAELLHEGLSQRAVATETGMSKSAVARLALAIGAPRSSAPPQTTDRDAGRGGATPSTAAASTREGEGPDGLDDVLAAPPGTPAPAPGVPTAAVEADPPPVYTPRIAPLTVVKPAEMDAGPMPAFLDRRRAS